MDFPTFNLNRFYSLRNKDGDTLNLSAFNGQTSIIVWKKGENKPTIKVNIGTYAASKMIKKLKELSAAPGETRVPLVFSTWNRDNKAFEPDYTICLVKDGDTLNLSAFNGQTSIIVWKKGENKPTIKVNIGTYAAS